MLASIDRELTRNAMSEIQIFLRHFLWTVRVHHVGDTNILSRTIQRWQRIAMSEEDAHASIDRELAWNAMSEGLVICHEPLGQGFFISLVGRHKITIHNGIFIYYYISVANQFCTKNVNIVPITSSVHRSLKV